MFYLAAMPITVVSQPYLRFVGVLGEGRGWVVGALLTAVRIFHVLPQQVWLNWDKFQSPYSSMAVADANESSAEIHKQAHVPLAYVQRLLAVAEDTI